MRSGFGSDLAPGSIPPPRKLWYLRVLNGPQAEQSFAIDPTPLILGRQTGHPSNALLDLTACEIDQPHTISRKHARLEWVEDALQITDLSSRNGTIVEGRRLEPNTPVELHIGHRIQLGSLTLAVTETAERTSVPPSRHVELDHEDDDLFVPDPEEAPPTVQETVSQTTKTASTALVPESAVNEPDDQLGNYVTQIAQIQNEFQDALIQQLVKICNQFEDAFDDFMDIVFNLLVQQGDLAQSLEQGIERTIYQFEQQKNYKTAQLLKLLSFLLLRNSEETWGEFREAARFWLVIFQAWNARNPRRATRNLFKALIFICVANADVRDHYQNYIVLFGNLFDKAEKTQGNQELIKAELRRNQHYLTPGFRELFRTCLTAMLLDLDRATIQDAAKTIFMVCTRIHDFTEGNVADNLRLAVTGYEVILPSLDRETDLWMRVNYVLGLAYSGLAYSSEQMPGQRLEHLATSRKYFEQIRESSILKENEVLRQETLLYLGAAYRDLEQYDQAQNCFRELLVISTEEQSEVRARARFNLGQTRILQEDSVDRLTEAVQLFEQAAEVYTREHFPSEYIYIQCELGFRYRQLNQLPEAQQAYQAAIITLEESLGDELLQNASTLEAQQQIFDSWEQVYQQMIEVCIEQKRAADAIEYVERNKARKLVELIAARNLLPRGSIPTEVIESYQQLRKEIADVQQTVNILQFDAVSKGVQDTQDRGDLVRSRTRLSQLRRDLDRLIKQRIHPIDPSFGSEATAIKWRDIRGLLPDNDTVMIAWYLTRTNLYTFIVTRSSSQPEVFQSKIENPGQSLDVSLNDYFSDYSSPEKHERWKEDLGNTLQSFSELLEIDRIVKFVRERAPQCTQLILVPHRFLHIFPLHALPLGNHTCLLDEFQIRYAPSAQLLKLNQSPDAINFDQLFAVQNPTSDLSHSDVEVAAIQTYFDSTAEIYAKEDATKKAIKEILVDQALRRANYVHFSCHGSFDYLQPMKSNLKLADGELSWTEIIKFELTHCRLVTLSGCETGLSGSTLGNWSDEYISLASGFLYAGSPSVVSSLWKVDDLSTALLMIKFYQALKQRRPVAEALQQAQLWLRDVDRTALQEFCSRLPLTSRNEREELSEWIETLKLAYPFQSPYYWAGFYAIGH